jgi:hypothetical protein
MDAFMSVRHTNLPQLGNITHFAQYRSLIEWAAHSVDAGHLLELQCEFKDHRMEPWR